MFTLNVNTDACIGLTNKLEKINRSALPLAIRDSLNMAAKDVKQVTMPASARSEFTQRQKNFFTANSRFEYAQGFNINSMKATVGFYENKLANASTNYAVKDLERQEHSGNIGGKSFIPLSTARIGSKGNVRSVFRLKKIRERGIVNARNQTGANKKEKFIKAVFKAGPGGYVLGSTIKGENILWKVNSLSSNLKTKKLDLTPLYDVSKNRSVKVNATHFMKEASLLSAKKMEGFYIANAQKQMKKYYGKL